MVIKKTRITRFVSSAVAAACLATGLNFAPFTMEIEAADQLTAFEITEEMQIGWNLGNTLDAYMSDANHQPLESYGLEAETCWGNPKTTPELIAAVKAKGFNTIRVPVTWFQHVDKNNGYKIDEAWLTARLEAHYTKDEILEGYLNTINYGGVFGIENASKYYFNKLPKGIPFWEFTLPPGCI